MNLPTFVGQESVNKRHKKDGIDRKEDTVKSDFFLSLVQERKDVKQFT